MKKRLLLFLVFLPALAFAQTRFYSSADAGLYFGKFLEYTGYGGTLSTNIELAPQLYVGVAAGAVQTKPFIVSASYPVLGRVTFFTASDEEKPMPFGLFEAGKLFYQDDNYNGTSGQTMKGQIEYFTGVGLQLPSRHKTHLFFALGLAGFNYNLQVSSGGTASYNKPYHYQRFGVRAGIMLPHSSAHHY